MDEADEADSADEADIANIVRVKLQNGIFNSIFFFYIVRYVSYVRFLSFCKNLLANNSEDRYDFDFVITKRVVHNGVSPSGKAAVFGTAMRRFESFHPKL